MFKWQAHSLAYVGATKLVLDPSKSTEFQWPTTTTMMTTTTATATTTNTTTTTIR